MYKLICKAYKAEEDKDWLPSEELTNEAIEEINTGRPIRAVKLFHDAHIGNLCDCKDLVEFLMKRKFA